MSRLFFSKAVLKGLRMKGFTDERIRRMMGWTPAKLKTAIAGKHALCDSMLDVIERETGYSTGQLAALSVEPEGGPLTEICDVLATVMPPRSALRRG